MPNLPHDLNTVPPFSWLVTLGAHFPWVYVMALFLGPATLVVAWQGLVFFRAVQVHAYKKGNEARFTHFRDGRKRAKPINVDKARERRITWPQLILPLYLVAWGMFAVQGIWFHPDTYVLLAVLWFLFTSVRKIMGIRAARKVFIADPKHGAGSLPNTFWQDVAGYYECGWSSSSHKAKRKPYEPLFDKGIIGTLLNKICQFGIFAFGPGSPLWSLLRPWDWPMLICDLIVLAAWAFIWPLAAVITPGYYLEVVKDFKRWTQPWWRTHRNSSYNPTVKIVKGDVIKDEPGEAGGDTTGSAVVDRRR
jgi:hypothetical protein